MLPKKLRAAVRTWSSLGLNSSHLPPEMCCPRQNFKGTVKLSVLPPLCILERPWSVDIGLDSLTFDPRTVPTLVGRNREDELIAKPNRRCSLSGSSLS